MARLNDDQLARVRSTESGFVLVPQGRGIAAHARRSVTRRDGLTETDVRHAAAAGSGAATP